MVLICRPLKASILSSEILLRHAEPSFKGCPSGGLGSILTLNVPFSDWIVFSLLNRTNSHPTTFFRRRKLWDRLGREKVRFRSLRLSVLSVLLQSFFFFFFKHHLTISHPPPVVHPHRTVRKEQNKYKPKNHGMTAMNTMA